MTKKWLFIFSVLCLSKTNAQNNSIFNGGNADGFTVNSFTQTTIAANNTVFNGGNGDGFAVNCFAQLDIAINNNLFNGGNGDGFAVNCFAQLDIAINNNLFNGGNGDGFAVNCLAQLDVAINNNLFNGGNADGFSINCFAQPTIAANNNLFNGGNADGFAFSRVGSFGTEVPLPIELISFSANCQNQNIIIKWTTASENNNDYFSLEHSTDAANWIIIKIVNGAGNSSTVQNYSFTDSLTQNAVSYFRLKQTDFDGKSKYSKVITIRSCKENLTPDNLIIYPNPAKGIINFLFNGDIGQVRSIEVFNVLGERVYYSVRYQSYIDLTNKSNGIYFVHFNLFNKTITTKIIIER